MRIEIELDEDGLVASYLILAMGLAVSVIINDREGMDIAKVLRSKEKELEPAIPLLDKLSDLLMLHIPIEKQTSLQIN